MHARAGIPIALVLALFTTTARADEPAKDEPPKDAPPKEDAKDAPPEVRPADDPRRKTDATPHPVSESAAGKNTFTIDPIADGGILIFGTSFGLLSTAILDTGEVRPQQIAVNFAAEQLLAIDRPAIRQSLHGSGRLLSNIGLGAIAGYALLDTILDGVREGPTASLVDAVLYAESAMITLGVTNLAKIAFRRPRPEAYIERQEFINRGGNPANYQNDITDSALSFFSGHSAEAAAVSATATYIAFQRAPGTARPWLTLGGGALLTSFVGYERVRSGAHFPTDVLGGIIAGAAIGALVPHLHRTDSAHQRRVWIGAAPTTDGGTVSASGLF